MNQQQVMKNAYDEPISNDGEKHYIQIDVPMKYEKSLLHHINENWNDSEDTHDIEGLIGYLAGNDTELRGFEFHSTNPEKWFKLVQVGEYGKEKRRYGNHWDYKQLRFSLKQIIGASILIDE